MRASQPATPPLFQHAFRLCFLLAAAWAAAAVPIWLCAYMGFIRIADVYGGVNWHAHELIFGYAAMVLCGFLFTAIPNWTGRLPVSGWPLAALALLWLAGRLAMIAAFHIGPLAAAIIDCLFLAMVLAVATREVAAGKNWRNLRVLVIVLGLLSANILFHASMLTGHMADLSLRASVGAFVILITLMGGRLAPSFTRNWLAKRGAARLPAPFDRLDALAIAASALGVLAWIAAPEGAATSLLAALAALLLSWRLARWRGWAAWREPLLLILHIGYAFLPLGFALLSVNAAWPDVAPAQAAIHAWTAGAIGVMTLAVMTRASLGHTGRALTATRGTNMIYGAILAAAALRIVASFALDWRLPLLEAASLAWALAFVMFLAVYGPILASRRL